MVDLREISDLFTNGKAVCHTVQLGPGVAGFVYKSRKGVYHIFVSEDLSPEGRRHIIFHEINHILKDMPVIPYVIGVDMQRYSIETSAERFAREVGLVYFVGSG